MGLGAAISTALEGARVATEDLQEDVIHESYVNPDALGEGDPQVPVTRKARVSEGLRQHITADGREVAVQAVVSFLPDSEGAAPVKVGARDRLTLPSGYTGPIVEVRGQRTTTVYIGARLAR